VQDLFLAIFSPDELHALGLQTKAFVRSTAIACTPFVLGLLAACSGGDRRTIAAAHRAFETLAGRPVARSSFDARMESPATVTLLWRLFAKLLLHANRHERRSWPREVQQFYDIVVEDGTQVRVSKSLAERLRSTTPGQAALKLLATLSLKQGCLDDVRLAAALHHDAKLLRTELQAGALYLRDLGFYDHTQFAAIDDAEAFFVSLLKSTTKVLIEHVAEGLNEPATFVGRALVDDLPLKDVLDCDGTFRLAGGTTRTFRVIGVMIGRTDRHDKPLAQKKRLWLVTNLSREQATPRQVAALYRLRYESIERLFRRAKSLAKLKELNSGRMPVLMVFVLSSLLVETLAAKLTKQLEDRWGWGEVSADRVLKVLGGWLWGVGRALCEAEPRRSVVWDELTQQLLHWGGHPNARQRTRTSQVLAALA
jgi:hypothetical protein